MLGGLSSTAADRVIHVDRCRKTYGQLVAVDDVSFDVADGEIFGLIGPNGAGKTTTLECVEGLRTPDRGRISVLGLDPVRDSYQLAATDRRATARGAAAEADPGMGGGPFLGRALSDARCRPAISLLEQLGLGPKRQAAFMSLSGGQKQRLFIALALINDPEVIFLDELTTGLDPQSRRTIWELVRGIRERGKTVFLTTHLMEEAERLCDRVAIIDHGRIVDIDSPERLVARHCPERRVVLRLEERPAMPCTSARFRESSTSAKRTAASRSPGAATTSSPTSFIACRSIGFA